MTLHVNDFIDDVRDDPQLVADENSQVPNFSIFLRHLKRVKP